MTKQKRYINSYCSIKGNTINLNGVELFNVTQEVDFLSFIKAAYKKLNINYSKFYKMDDLSKLAFLAASVVLDANQVTEEQNQNIAIVFSNRASSLETDRDHQEAIQNKANYFPSPAVFVYTLPNICIGEISIKYKLNSENSFFIFADFNAAHLHDYTNALLDQNKADKVLCGWVEFDKNNVDAFVYMVSQDGDLEHNKNQIDKIYYNK